MKSITLLFLLSQQNFTEVTWSVFVHVPAHVLHQCDASRSIYLFQSTANMDFVDMAVNL